MCVFVCMHVCIRDCIMQFHVELCSLHASGDTQTSLPIKKGEWHSGHTLLTTPPDKDDSRIATVVIRGSTANIMDDVERAVDDAVNVYKSLTKDSRLVPGAGATEIELAKQLTSFGEVSCGFVCHNISLSYKLYPFSDFVASPSLTKSV